MKVAIIGAGAIGVRIGMELAERDVEVEIYDAKYPEYGTTGRSIGVVSVQQRDPRLVSLALESSKLMAELDKRLKQDVGYPVGVMGEAAPHVSIALTPKDREDIARQSNIWRSAGADVKEMSPIEVKDALLPWIDDRAFTSAFVTTNDYKVTAFPYAYGMLMIMRSKGGKVFRSREVTGFETNGSIVKAAVINGSQRVEADAFVIAAGAASPKLISKLGDNPVPVRIALGGGAVTEPYKYAFKPIVTLDRKGYRFTQTLRNEFVMAVYDMGVDNPDMSVEESLRVMERMATVTVKLFPSFTYMNALRQWGAYLDYTSDRLPVVGWSPRHENVYYAYGFGNYGFSVGPAMASRAACEIASGSRDPLLDPFRPPRA
ncbi:MAG: NAD(P)/FAD-dependent oxidoreductase [Conexivisphaera sp.]|jgi:sarcosine oxidase subunit beta|nr:FAD-binding oxidoreductase [Conexivisphaerales archaeon]